VSDHAARCSGGLNTEREVNVGSGVREWVASFEDVEFKPEALVRQRMKIWVSDMVRRRKRVVVIVEGSTTAMPCAHGFIDRTASKLRHHANGSNATHRGPWALIVKWWYLHLVPV